MYIVFRKTPHSKLKYFNVAHSMDTFFVLIKKNKKNTI